MGPTRLDRRRRAQGESLGAFRRPTRAFEEAARNGAACSASTASSPRRGGVPLIEDGKLIGAIGCSGGTSTEDEATCLAGAATINGAAN